MTKSPHIYLDYNATAPVRPEARAAAIAAMDAGANASSVHGPGRRARAMVDRAREDVAALVGAEPDRIVFASGGTEANAIAIFGGASSGLFSRIVVFALEHDSVLKTARLAADRFGLELVEAGADRTGVIDLEALAHALFLPPLTGGVAATRPRGGAANADPGAPPSVRLPPDQIRGSADTSPVNGGGKDGRTLVCVMAANNETGVLQPLTQVRALCSQAGATLHVDAVQIAGRLPFDASAFEFTTLSAHKLGGIQGAGALVLGRGVETDALWGGGAQERRRRPGTEPVAAIAAFGAAARAAQTEIPAASEHARWRDEMEARLAEAFPDLQIFGGEAPRLPQTSCLGLAGLAAETQVIALDLEGVAISAGSACSSGKVECEPCVDRDGRERRCRARRDPRQLRLGHEG